MVSKEEFRSYVFELVKDDKSITRGHVKKGNSYIVFMAFSIALMIFFILMDALFLIPLIMISFITFSFLAFFNTKRNKKIENKYKDKLVDFLLKDYEHVYNKDGGIASREFKKSPMYEQYDKYETEDFLKICLSSEVDEASCYMQLCDLKTIKEEIKENRDGSYETNDVILFEGAFGFIEFKESFKARLYINCPVSLFNKKLQYVKLEDMDFNKKFNVYSDDQIEARYILNPRIMDLLIKLNDKVCKFNSKYSKYLSIALINNKMYFAFEGGFELFSLNYKYKNINEIFDDFYDDMDIILNLVNEIRKNYRIFKV